MREIRPRREVHVPTVPTRVDLNYVPKKSREPKVIEILTGQPAGFRIAWQQRIGIEASAETFDQFAQDGNTEELQELADLLSYVTIGTAHHTFGTPMADELDYRRIPIPELVHRETKARTTQEHLIERASDLLAGTASLAVAIENMVYRQSDPSRLNEKIGRAMATTGLVLAAIHDEIASSPYEDEVGMQKRSRDSSAMALARSFEMSGVIGARPTVAQIPDDQSPLRRYLNDNPEILPMEIYHDLLNRADDKKVA